MAKGGNKRERNNASVKLCREKKKKEEEERKLKTENLKAENAAKETSIKALKEELAFMTRIVTAHAEAAGGSAKKCPEFAELLKISKEQ